MTVESSHFNDGSEKMETNENEVSGHEKNIDSLANNNDLKFIFVGGKGGVGKTTSSAAIAAQLSLNKKVLLVSTDPAHSLSDVFRQQFGGEPKCPDLVKLPNLFVMEVNPTTTVDTELNSWMELAKQFPAADDITTKIKSFQDWISGVPGIDEATALGSAVSHIESGKYDLIVFDTAPTGHTLKLLALPDIIQIGIEKLESWQGAIWSYWETIKGGGNPFFATAKQAVAEKLKSYKGGIQKVGQMLQDQKRTRFVVVCIAEYLSICETRRLLQELRKCNVTASHIIVNQLVDDFLSNDEMDELYDLLGGVESRGHYIKDLKRKVLSCCKLTSSRNTIQNKYLKELKSYHEVKTSNPKLAIIEVPLLPTEVTGHEAILEFSRLLVSEGQQKRAEKRRNGSSEQTHDQKITSKENWDPEMGDIVTIHGLLKKPEYNGLEGEIISYNKETKRYGVKIVDKVINENQAQSIALQKANISKTGTTPQKKTAKQVDDTVDVNKEPSKEKIDKYSKLLEDQEIAAMIKANPKLGDAVRDVQKNPMNFMKYMMDPDMAPFVQKAMDKFRKMV